MIRSRKSRHRIYESKRYGRRRFIRESLSAEMEKQLDQEMRDHDEIDVDGDFIAALSQLPSFKAETVTLKPTPIYKEPNEACYQEALDDAYSSGGIYGTGTYYLEEVEMSDMMSSTDPATQYIIDHAINAGYTEICTFRFSPAGYDWDYYLEDGDCTDVDVESYGVIFFGV